MSLSRPRKILCILCAAALSVFTVAVEHVRTSGGWQFSGAQQLLTSGLQALTYTIVFILLWKLIARFDKSAEKSAEADDSQKILCRWNARSVLLTALLLFALYLPYLLVFFPGVGSMDTTNQIKDFITGTMPIEISWNPGEPLISCFLNDHHPVTDTFLFVLFTEGLGRFVGRTMGVFLYCCTQAAATAVTLSVMLCRMERLAIPYKYRRAGMWFLGLCPFISLYAIGMLKDSVFSLFFVWYFLTYVDICREGAAPGRLFRLIVLSLILALTKKTGVYLIILSNLALILLSGVRKRFAAWALSFVLPAFIVLMLLPKVIFPLTNIFQGGSQESLGFAMQMVARTYLDHGEELTDAEIQTIDNIMEVDKIEECYSAYNYDEVKHLFNFYATPAQLSDFKQLWLRLFVRYPSSGTKALMGTAGGFFSPTETVRVYYEFAHSDYVQVDNPEVLAPARKAFQTWYKWISNLPGIGILFQCVLYLWWLPLISLLRVIVMKRDDAAPAINTILCYVPIAVSVLILVASPYSMGRYGLPQFYTIPLVLGLSSLAANRPPLPADETPLPTDQTPLLLEAEESSEK